MKWFSRKDRIRYEGGIWMRPNPSQTGKMPPAPPPPAPPIRVAIVNTAPPELHELSDVHELVSETLPLQAVTICTCGWKSEPHTNHDMAADAHLEHAVNALRDDIKARTP